MSKIKDDLFILLIDDDPIFNAINLNLFKRLDMSFATKDYINAQDALAELESLADDPDRFPDIIFLDLNMPLMDGWEFLEAYEKLPEKIRNGCKVYILTSSIDHYDIEKSKTYKSVSKFITKPLTPDHLVKIVSTRRR